MNMARARKPCIRYLVTRGDVNEDIQTRRVRSSNGTFARVYVGNYANKAAAKAAGANTRQEFGGRKAKYREIRNALGLAAG